MSIFSFAKKESDVAITDFEAWWAAHAKPFIHEDVEPIMKKFVQQFSTTFGMQAVVASMAAVASLATTPFAEVATGLATTLYADAKVDAGSEATLDAQQILQTVQSALQVAKSVSNTVTPADTTAATAITVPSSAS